MSRVEQNKNSINKMNNNNIRKQSSSEDQHKRRSYITYTGLSLKGLILPDIELFREVNRKYDKILSFIDLTKVLKRVFITKPGGNEIFNRYLRRSWTRMHKHAISGDQERFMSLGNLILKRSKAARVLFLWRVMPTWYKHSSIRRILVVLDNLDKLINRDSKRFSFRRIRIPKPDGSLRPLAIPPLEWRVLSNWNNVYFTIWAHGTGINLMPNQFGILKGGGLKAAWLEIIKRLPKAKYIYEFDLSKFFDSIPLYWVKRGLLHYKFPLDLIERATEMIRWSSTVLKREKLLETDATLESIHEKDESIEAWDMFRLKGHFDLNRLGYIIEHVLNKGCPQEFHEGFHQPFIDISELANSPTILNQEDLFWWNSIFHYVYTERKNYPKKVISRMIYKDIDKIIKEYSKEIGKEHKEKMKGPFAKFNIVLTNDRILPFTRGVPQGFGLSPMLSCFALFKVMNKWKDVLVMYLDDGIILSEKPIDIEKLKSDFKSIGIQIAPHKSGYVKEGVWRKDLKFLGLEYSGETGNIRASTKSGKTMELPALKFMESEELNKYFKFYTVKWIDSLRNKSNVERWDAIQALGFGLNLIFRGRNEDRPKQKLSKASLMNIMRITEGNKVSSELSKSLLDLIRLKSNMNRVEFNNYLNKIKHRPSDAIRKKEK